MSFRKRNKIKIPTGEGNSNLKLNKNKINLDISEEEGEDELDLIPLKPKRGKPTQTNFDLEEDDDDEDIELKPIKPKAQNPFLSKSYKSTPILNNSNSEEEEKEEEEEDNNIVYQDEINKLKTTKHEPEQVIMNMEDMIASGNISDDENEPVNKPERLDPRQIRSDEKEYIKLMDVDDKFELIDNLTKGGKVKLSELKSIEDEDEFDITNNEFMDERLALSKNEQIRQAKTRRQQIEEAISSTPLEELKDSTNKVESPETESQLPQLYNEDNDEDYSIDDIIHQNKLILRKKEMELKVLTKEYDQLKSQQSELIEKLNAISL
ncbi:pre-mRNA-splicing factor Ntr2p [Monosporozyma servazzii]